MTAWTSSARWRISPSFTPTKAVAKYSDEGIRSAVTLSSRYLTARFLPDKAIDIMDEAGSKARIGAMTRPPELKEIDAEIEAIRVEKETSIKDQDFEKAARLRDRSSHWVGLWEPGRTFP